MHPQNSQTGKRCIPRKADTAHACVSPLVEMYFADEILRFFGKEEARNWLLMEKDAALASNTMSDTMSTASTKQNMDSTKSWSGSGVAKACGVAEGVAPIIHRVNSFSYGSAGLTGLHPMLQMVLHAFGGETEVTRERAAPRHGDSSHLQHAERDDLLRSGGIYSMQKETISCEHRTETVVKLAAEDKANTEDLLFAEEISMSVPTSCGGVSLDAIDRSGLLYTDAAHLVLSPQSNIR